MSELNLEQIETTKKLRGRTSDVLGPKHDDVFLQRWLKARSWDVDKAEKMLRASLLWRKQNRMDTAAQEYVPSEFMKRHLPTGPCGETKEGNPIWILPFGYLDCKGLLRSAKKVDLIKHIFVSMEQAVAQLETQSQKWGKPITQLYIIADMHTFGLRQFLQAVDLMRNIAITFNENYPELLKNGTLINASTLVNMAYSLIRNFIDESTQQKITLHGTDTWTSTILKDVDPSQLPAYLGGTFTFENPEDNWWEVLFLPKEIPSTKFLVHSKDSEIKDGTTVTVNKGESFSINITIKEVGTELRWNFQTEEYDIAFGIILKSANGDVSIINMDRVDSHLYPEQGTFACSQEGTYEVHFDNTYSVTKSKKLTYKLETILPKEMTETNSINL